VPGAPGEHTGQAQPEFLLEARDLSISFGGLAALTNVNLQVRPRTIHGLIGPNGSGKSTLVNVITGLYRPGGGAVCLEGEPISGRPPHEIARRGIGRTYQAPNLCRSMSVLENVLLGRAVHFRAGGLACLVHSRAMRREEERNLRVCRGLLGALGLSEVASARPESLPFGLQRVLEVARAVAMEPRLLLLDEPAAGLSPGELEGLELILRRLRDSGMTILLIEHNVELVMRVCDVVTVIDTGEVICTGRPDVVRQDPRTLAAYLGTAP
jgi:ABC-type branched-subunit amino acid transport system ATPase component